MGGLTYQVDDDPFLTLTGFPTVALLHEMRRIMNDGIRKRLARVFWQSRSSLMRVLLADTNHRDVERVVIRRVLLRLNSPRLNSHLIVVEPTSL